MAAAFAEAVSGPATSDWTVRSAGTHSPGGQAVCPITVSLVPAAAGHLSAPVDREDIRLADLVITASRAERSWIAQRVPESRQRTFTLREALMLDDRRSDQEPAGGIEHYVASLRAGRGTIALPTSPSSRWRRATDPLDFRDVHGLRRGEHRRGIAQVAEAAADLGRRMRGAVIVAD